MNYWVLKTDYSFTKVTAGTMNEAVEITENALCTVSTYFKSNYSKYSRLWDKVEGMDLDGIDDVLYGQFCAIHTLCVDDVMCSKNRLQLDEDSIAVYNLSDYNFNQIIEYLQAIVNTLI